MTFLFVQCEKDPEIALPVQVEIPGPSFLAAMIEQGVDANGDSIIDNVEAEAVLTLDVGGSDISDMTGIEKFIDLVISNNLAIGSESSYADCYLDIENMPTLEEVSVWTMPFPTAGFRLCMEGSPNVYFTTGCSRYSFS